MAALKSARLAIAGYMPLRLLLPRYASRSYIIAGRRHGISAVIALMLQMMLPAPILLATLLRDTPLQDMIRHKAITTYAAAITADTYC